MTESSQKKIETTANILAKNCAEIILGSYGKTLNRLRKELMLTENEIDPILWSNFIVELIRRITPQ